MRKKSLMRTLIVSLAALSAAIGTAQADTLGEAMVSAQDSNPTLAAHRRSASGSRGSTSAVAWSRSRLDLTVALRSRLA